MDSTFTPPIDFTTTTSSSASLRSLRLTISFSVSIPVFVVTLVILMVLRYRYGYRFGRGCPRRSSQTNANVSQPPVMATAQPSGYYVPNANKEVPVFMPPPYNNVAYTSYPVAGEPAGPTGVVNTAYTVPYPVMAAAQ